ncbi:MAG: hypothetical protein WAW96_02910, partial [Alphaproteobacteria bacterium]
MSQPVRPIRFVLLVAVLAAATVAIAMAIHAGWDDFSVRRVEDIRERNFYIAPPHHLTVLIMPDDTLVVRPCDIDEALLPRLRFRLKITDVQNRQPRPLVTDYTAHEAAFTFHQSGQYTLNICVLDTATGQTAEFKKADVFVGPNIAHGGISTTEAMNRLDLSRLAPAAKQVAAAAVILILGMTVLAVFRSHLPLAWLLLLAFPVGVGLWTCLSLVVMIVHLKYTVWTMT